MLFQRECESLLVWTPAKLNLFLEVLGRRADGFHELETLMISISLYDTLRFSPADSGVLDLRCFDASAPQTDDDRDRSGSQVPHEAVPTGPDNLVHQAADLLRRTYGVTAGVRIELFKRIPMAAGLAGGSSDAAATLAGLDRFWNLRLSIAELSEVAAQLGSDVAFFLPSAAAALCKGRGERVQPLALPRPLHFVIVKPASGLSTAQVFKNCVPATEPKSARPLADALARGDVARAADCFHNNLQSPAEALNHDVTRLKTAFSRQPVLGHMMSGSGTSYFGLCANRRQALRISARMKAHRIGHVFVAQSQP